MEDVNKCLHLSYDTSKVSDMRTCSKCKRVERFRYGVWVVQDYVRPTRPKKVVPPSQTSLWEV